MSSGKVSQAIERILMAPDGSSWADRRTAIQSVLDSAQNGSPAMQEEAAMYGDHFSNGELSKEGGFFDQITKAWNDKKNDPNFFEPTTVGDLRERYRQVVSNNPDVQSAIGTAKKVVGGTVGVVGGMGAATALVAGVICPPSLIMLGVGVLIYKSAASNENDQQESKEAKGNGQGQGQGDASYGTPEAEQKGISDAMHELFGEKLPPTLMSKDDPVVLTVGEAQRAFVKQAAQAIVFNLKGAGVMSVGDAGISLAPAAGAGERPMTEKEVLKFAKLVVGFTPNERELADIKPEDVLLAQAVVSALGGDSQGLSR